MTRLAIKLVIATMLLGSATAWCEAHLPCEDVLPPEPTFYQLDENTYALCGYEHWLSFGAYSANAHVFNFGGKWSNGIPKTPLEMTEVGVDEPFNCDAATPSATKLKQCKTSERDDMTSTCAFRFTPALGFVGLKAGEQHVVVKMPRQELPPPPPPGCHMSIPAPRIYSEHGNQTGVVNSYCWSQGPVNLCADGNFSSWTTSSKPLSLAPDNALTLEMPEQNSEIKHIEYVVIPIDGHANLEDNIGQETIAWPGQVKSAIPLASLQMQQVKIPMKHGLNLLLVFAWWQNGNDSAYGFLIDFK